MRALGRREKKDAATCGSKRGSLYLRSGTADGFRASGFKALDARLRASGRIDGFSA